MRIAFSHSLMTTFLQNQSTERENVDPKKKCQFKTKAVKKRSKSNIIVL